MAIQLHDIEKQIIVEKLCHQTWQNYCIEFPMLVSKCHFPRLKIEALAIRVAGHYKPPHILNNNFGTIMINTAFFDQSPDQMLEVIVHEFAHHVTYFLYPKAKQWHGPEFRFVMSCLGYDGSTYHHMNVKVAKQTVKRNKDDLFDLS